MKVGDIINVTLKEVKFVPVERMIQGQTFGSYESSYVGSINGYSDGIVVVDSIAAKLHPDWEKRTSNRAGILTSELAGKTLRVRILEVFSGIECFEAELV